MTNPTCMNISPSILMPKRITAAVDLKISLTVSFLSFL